jgi:hypothetical protein
MFALLSFDTMSGGLMTIRASTDGGLTPKVH